MPGIALSEGALEVSNVDVGDQLISRLQMLGEDFDTEVEGWQVDRVRDELKTERYFHGVYYPKAFQIDGRKYVHGLAALARRAGARIFEDTPVVSIDPSGIRKRIVTPSARLRASHIVLAGNVHLGAPLRRLSETLLPVWRYAGGDRAARRAAGRGDHLPGIGERQRRHRSFPHRRRRPADVGEPGNHLGGAAASGLRRPLRGGSARSFRSSARSRSPKSGAARSARPCTACRRSASCGAGLWVASGFGRQGLNTTAMAGQLIARSILWGDDRWRLFSPFELVWAGGPTGRVAGHAVGMWARGSSAAAGALARYRERARVQERIREARLAEANRQAGTRGPPQRRPPPGAPRPGVRSRRPPASRGEGEGASLKSLPACGGNGTASRKKVRKLAPVRCNFGCRAPYLVANNACSAVTRRPT